MAATSTMSIAALVVIAVVILLFFVASAVRIYDPNGFEDNGATGPNTAAAPSTQPQEAVPLSRVNTLRAPTGDDALPWHSGDNWSVQTLVLNKPSPPPNAPTASYYHLPVLARASFRPIIVPMARLPSPGDLVDRPISESGPSHVVDVREPGAAHAHGQ
ncbi:hypothetical protein GQ54DRAFT_295400 [Martensiomyces pterosporus]|nr:hypothetical protein GQ54DRAFT_295400 [Martensiomyces pterosporus]